MTQILTHVPLKSLKSSTQTIPKLLPYRLFQITSGFKELTTPDIFTLAAARSSSQQEPPCRHTSPPHAVPSQSATLRASATCAASSGVARQLRLRPRTQARSGTAPDTAPAPSSQGSAD
ncbi:Thioredoxin-related transmembrane protein 2-like protein, partial [Frankliniella fusca]